MALKMIRPHMRLNLGKTVVVEKIGRSVELDPQRLTYQDHPVKIFQANENCRHLGFWTTANGDITVTKQRVLEKLEAALAVLEGKNSQGTVSQHGGERIPLLGSSSTMLPKQKELDKIQSRWVQTYKRAEHLAAGAASDIFVFAEDWCRKEHFTPVNIIAQERRTSG
jgi:hypothetical protein